MSSRNTAVDTGFDVACLAAAGAVIVLIWTGALVALQALGTALFIAVLLYFVAGRLEGGGRTTTPFRSPREVRRDTISQPQPPTDPAQDRWAGVRMDEAAEMLDEEDYEPEEVMP